VSNIRYSVVVRPESISEAFERLTQTLGILGFRPVLLEGGLRAAGTVTVLEGDREVKVGVVVTALERGGEVEVTMDVLDPPGLTLRRDVCDVVASRLGTEIARAVLRREVREVKMTYLRRLSVNEVVHLQRVLCG